VNPGRLLPLRRLLRLSLRDKVALVRAAGAILVARVGLRMLPAHRVAQLVGAPLLFSDADAAPPARWETVPIDRRPEMRMLVALLRHRTTQSGSACLIQSLSISMLLRCLEPRLRIGVASQDGDLRAHAWVEANGHSFLADASFAPLYSQKVKSHPHEVVAAR
jgi:hypothetical protein